MTVPLNHVFVLAGALFSLGAAGVVFRRNTVFMLLSIEVMLNAAGLAFIAAGAKWGAPDGQIIFLFILSTAAAEVSVGLALVLELRRRFRTLDADSADELGD